MDETIIDYYNEQWQGKEITIEEKCYARFILYATKQITRKHGRPLSLDLGCGRGWLTNELSRYGETIGVDLSVDEAKRAYPDIEFHQKNVVVDHIDGKYDLVISNQVFEHIPRDQKKKYLQVASDLLKTGGYLILLTPDPVNMVRLPNYMPQPVEDWLSREEFGKMSTEIGFEGRLMASCYFYPSFIEWYPRLKWPYWIAYGNIGYRIIEPLLKRTTHGISYVYIGKKQLK